MQARAAIAYKKVFLESAPPTRILDELYGRLLLDLETAKDGILRRDLRAKGEAISHAQSILDELSLALDHRAAPELSANLVRLYEFCALRMSAANMQLDIVPLEEAHKILSQLRESFREASGLIS
ncbi:MAG: flagellar export chaperone FliS [Myxococcota bacterium]